uniref:Uncharacterized protein n=1 Tax=viral metagenome TaxID=1070528 RepID=A0A6M3LLF1_9ZZZZ
MIEISYTQLLKAVPITQLTSLYNEGCFLNNKKMDCSCIAAKSDYIFSSALSLFRDNIIINCKINQKEIAFVLCCNGTNTNVTIKYKIPNDVKICLQEQLTLF